MNNIWNEEDTTLTKKIEFDNFTLAMVFVNKVADLAEEIQHHPKIEINYRTVTLKLFSHDAGDTVTERDRELARRIDTLL